MFGNTKKPQIATPSTLNGKPETVIGTNTSIVGSLKSDGNIRIDGSVEGDIEILGNLIIGETGRVIATLKAQNVHVSTWQEHAEGRVGAPAKPAFEGSHGR